MFRSHRWSVVLVAAAGLVPLSPPERARSQAPQAGVEVLDPSGKPTKLVDRASAEAEVEARLAGHL